VKFLVDMPLSPALADWLATRNHDAVHASRIGLAFEPDRKILQHAARQNRVVITADLDFPRLLAQFRANGPGLILFRSGDWSEVETTAKMAQVLELVPEAELARSIVVIEPARIRKRRLPIKTG
jgi:predicted nuclease of predicted toxin-antitoxin system